MLRDRLRPSLYANPQAAIVLNEILDATFVPVPSHIVTRYFSLIALWLSHPIQIPTPLLTHCGCRPFTLNAPLPGYSLQPSRAHATVRQYPNVLMGGRFLFTQRLELVGAVDVGCQFAKISWDPVPFAAAISVHQSVLAYPSSEKRKHQH